MFALGLVPRRLRVAQLWRLAVLCVAACGAPACTTGKAPNVGPAADTDIADSDASPVGLAPTAPLVDLPPFTSADDDRACRPSGSVDPEGGPVTYTVTWTRPGLSAPVLGDVLPATETAPGEVWTCTATATDEEGLASEPAADSTTIHAYEPAVTLDVPTVIAAAGMRTFVQRGDGTWTGWGSDTWGQLEVPTPGDVRAISGLMGACAVDAQGVAHCGSGYFLWRAGLFETGTWADLAMGYSFVCGLDGVGALTCLDAYTGDAIPTPPGTFTDVDAAWLSACALATDGSIACFDSEGGTLAAPVGDGFVSLASANAHVCGLTAQGEATCVALRGAATAPPGPDPGEVVSEIRAGDNVTWWIRADGTLGCEDGPPSVGRRSGCRAFPKDGPYSQLTAGSLHACARREDGRWRCWGSTGSGAGVIPTADTHWTRMSANGGGALCGLLTDGTIDCAFLPGEREAPAGHFVDLRTSMYTVCGVAADGRVTCNDADSGMAVGPSGPWRDFALQSFHACWLNLNGDLTCSESAGLGESYLGDRYLEVEVTTGGGCVLDLEGTPRCWEDGGRPTVPSEVWGALTDLRSATWGTCGRESDGTWTCWDFRGVGDEPPQEPFVDVAPNDNGGCGLRADGSIACWGRDAFPCLECVPAGHFVAVGGGSGGMACGLRDDGAPVCWGDVKRPVLP